MEGCRPVRDAGAAGGPIDVLFPPRDGRVLAPAEATRTTFDGVPVREVEALGGPLINCFVGDLVGDWSRSAYTYKSFLAVNRNSLLERLTGVTS